MTSASLLNPADRSGLQPLEPTRHIGGLADLIELCFGAEMDSGGRAAVREMRWLSQFGPALSLFSWAGLTQPPWKEGFVWLEGGRVVGCVTTQRAASSPRTWLMANVAVHPNHRRRGLALALTRATLDHIRRQGGQAAVLQVDHDNHGAQTLYRRMGFTHFATRTAWRRPSHLPPPPRLDGPLDIRLRARDERADEWALVQRIRPEGLAWNRPLSPQDFAPSAWTRLERWLAGQGDEHWVAAGRAGLAASLIVQSNLTEGDRLTLLVHPDYRGQLEAPLLTRGLRRLTNRAWPVHLDHPADDAPAETALRSLGFHPGRTLRWMKIDIR